MTRKTKAWLICELCPIWVIGNPYADAPEIHPRGLGWLTFWLANFLSQFVLGGWMIKIPNVPRAQ